MALFDCKIKIADYILLENYCRLYRNAIYIVAFEVPNLQRILRIQKTLDLRAVETRAALCFQACSLPGVVFKGNVSDLICTK